MAVSKETLIREQLQSLSFPWRQECVAKQVSLLLNGHLYPKEHAARCKVVVEGPPQVTLGKCHG